MNRIIETNRLYLKELTREDNADLACILCDKESMAYYPRPFNCKEVNNWIDWNVQSYRTNGYGLWAVILTDGDVFLGDCGVTIQEIAGENLPELGYHIKKDHWNNGYATEAAKACIRYGFEVLKFQNLYSYTQKNNHSSMRVAEKCGMHYVKDFTKTVMDVPVTEVLYRIQRIEYDKRIYHES